MKKVCVVDQEVVYDTYNESIKCISGDLLHSGSLPFTLVHRGFTDAFAAQKQLYVDFRPHTAIPGSVDNDLLARYVQQLRDFAVFIGGRDANLGLITLLVEPRFFYDENFLPTLMVPQTQQLMTMIRSFCFKVCCAPVEIMLRNDDFKKLIQLSDHFDEYLLHASSIPLVVNCNPDVKRKINILTDNLQLQQFDNDIREFAGIFAVVQYNNPLHQALVPAKVGLVATNLFSIQTNNYMNGQ